MKTQTILILISLVWFIITATIIFYKRDKRKKQKLEEGFVYNKFKNKTFIY